MQVDNGKLSGLAEHNSTDILQVTPVPVSTRSARIMLSGCAASTGNHELMKGIILMQLWVKDGRGWVRSAANRLKADSGGLADLYMEMLLQGKHSQISDFDDHLNDLTK